MDDDSSVRVAVRIRPQIPREVIDMCRVCTSVTPNEPQVWLGSDKAFTFDNVFDVDSAQHNVYGTCVQELVDGCLEGYNATVLAYGQTGSGKTYTMGTVFDVDIPRDEYGIIPRAVHHLFQSVQERQCSAIENQLPVPEFQIHCQFIELYNEEIVDLFDNAREPDSKNRRSQIRIHEDTNGAIYTVGVITQHVTSEEETIKCLRRGALSRTTATTQMNVSSSRSHAIFTLVVRQQRIVLSKDPDFDIDTADGMNEFETLTAKFHFVDLAGSERLKRTGATGDRAKEGISINCGLLALGNVISALGDKLKKGSHVPYRDSKLTRLLQDSLGGNSRTLMIACISPSDRDFMETLNTLKYANRARNIKNRVMVNQDKTSRTITSLRSEIQALQLELLEYKQGKRVLVDGVESVNDMFHENTMLQTESNNLRTRVKAMQETIESLLAKNVALLAEKTAGIWMTSGDDRSDISQLIQTYLKDIEDLRAKLLESEHTCEVLRRNAARSQSRLSMSPMHSHPLGFSGNVSVDDASALGVIEEAKRDVMQLMRTIRPRTKSEMLEKTEGPENDLKNEDDEDDVNGVDDDSSDSESEVDEQCRADLADITCEISIKQKLIDELELSQKRMQTLRKQYEDKLLQLQNKIRATQEERDRVLANLGSRDDQSGDKSRKVKAEYEKKLADLQGQLNKLHSAQREHAKLVKNQSEYEKQMRNLKAELAEMKRTKVRLMNKIKEEANRHHEAEAKRNREIAQLKKDSRVKENQIRTMEAAAKLKDAVLKRKHEEMAALRKGGKPMSDKVAGRFLRPPDNRVVARNKRQTIFSPKVAKNKWQRLEKDITKIVLSRQSVANMEKDMENALKERQILRDKLDKCTRKRNKAIRAGKDAAAVHELDEHIENITANIDYIQERISDSQANIIQIEEAKDGKDVLDSTALLSGLNFEEAKYLVDKLLAMTVNQSLNASQKEIGLKEMEAKYTHLSQSNNIQQQLLEHMLVQQDLSFASVLNLSETPDNDDSTPSTRPSSPFGSDIQHLDDIVIPVPLVARPTDKARRRTATSQELLYAKTEFEVYSDKSGTVMEEEEETVVNQKQEIMPNEMTYSLQRHASATVHKTSIINITTLGITQPNSLDNTPAPTPPLSPTPSLRRTIREGNVFSRLTAGESKTENGIHNRGRIAIALNNNNKVTKVETPLSLVCTHVAEGHSKAVLSVAADDHYLFSASKDRTVKMWDLQKGEEIQSLSGHPNNVVTVRYSSKDQLVFSVSSAFIKLWDIRSNICVQTLSSSGMTTQGEKPLSTPSRTLQMPNGESQINDIILDRHGFVLYSASGSSVRVWDLRKLQCVGKLAGGHQAPVMCLAVGGDDINSNTILTGSKDHYIRLFDACGDISGIHSPKLKLEPPHYDGIEALTIVDGTLFSGSRDACIKKWDLNSKKPVHSISKAHKDWVCGLVVMPSRKSVLSCSRDGYLKQWSVSDCKLVGEVQAPKQVNGIAKNSSAIFTASEDGSVGIWRQS